MRYKGYTWPHNPRTYNMSYERKVANQQLAQGNYRLQDLGLAHRVMWGEGEFVGSDAYTEFKKLASVFYDAGPGALVHPAWQATQVYFVELSVVQEPRADYVRYTFTFWEEVVDAQSAVEWVAATQEDSETSETVSTNTTTTTVTYHTVVSGESLWVIANKYGLSLSDLIALNPQIANPNLIMAGEQVRVA